ncbi:helix-turn-helix domain-containing protein [Roseomonas terrae]|uniref:Helix-turn-helix domain-containing protein n=1 Tax=Neoroseomonas terrae TaxID=424799 RepID=A0ABS5EEX0_9PROT|nr:helix-turn-helix domain-containing protein [Neoroseomonas terrae]MBR0649567.1 helix-turn-helix domain-containing protein [Neoroseomonas terrae]
MATREQDGHDTGPLPGTILRAIAHMRADLSRATSGAELARTAGLPQRTLRAHFRRFLGTSPLSWLQQARLAAVREALLAARPGDNVTEAAARHGITHLARFSAQYRRRFGELPSATLERGRAARARACVTLPAAPRHRPPVLVQPIACAAGRTRHEDCDFAESLAEQLTTEIGRMRSGPVRRLHAGERPDAAAGLSCYALTGRLVRSGERLRVVLRLSDTAERIHLWGDAFDGTAGHALALQDDILAIAVTAIHRRIEDAETERAWRQPPDCVTAHDLVMRAVTLIRAGDPDSNEGALDLALRAATLDPTDAAAAALIGACHARRVGLGFSCDWAGDRGSALHFDTRAAMLDPSEPLSLVARSIIASQMNDRAGAEAMTARALAISPGLAWAWERSGYVHVLSGNAVLGVEHLRRAMALSGPRAPVMTCLNGIAQARLWEGRPEEAASLSLQVLALNPRDTSARRVLPPCYALMGLDMQARRAIDHLRATTPEINQRWFARSNPALAWSDVRAAFMARMQDRLVGLGMPR